jgi:hypothetical protein
MRFFEQAYRVQARGDLAGERADQLAAEGRKRAAIAMAIRALWHYICGLAWVALSKLLDRNDG